MNNGLKAVTLLSVLIMTACLLIPGASDAAADNNNVGYGAGDGITVTYKDAGDGISGIVEISLADLSMDENFTVCIGGMETDLIDKSSIIDGKISILSKMTRLDTGIYEVRVYDGKGYDVSADLKVGPVAESVVLDRAAVTLVIGNSTVLSASVTPSDALVIGFLWSSSNNEVATVDDNGTVSAKSAGTAVISVKTGDLSAECTVTVVPADHSLVFVNGYGGVISEYSMRTGDAITAPADPVRDGYEFSGWVPDVPAFMPDEDLIISASWTKIVVDPDTGVKTEVKEHTEIAEDGKQVGITELESTSADGTVVSNTSAVDDGSSRTVTQTVIIQAADGVSSEVVDAALVQAEKDRAAVGGTSDVQADVVIDANTSDSVSVSRAAFKSLNEAELPIEVQTKFGTVTFDSSVCGTLSADAGNVVLNVNSDLSKLMNEKVKDTVGSNRFIDLSLKDSTDSFISDLGGDATVSFSYDAGEGKTLNVRHVNDDGTIDSEVIESTYANGILTFTTGHFSVFMVEEVSEPEPGTDGGNNNTVLIIVAAVLIAIIIIAVVLFRKR